MSWGVQKVIRHPSYKYRGGYSSLAYDIALLVLDKAAKTKPAALAPANFKLPRGNNPEYLFTAGWGETEYESTPKDLM